MYRYFHDEKNKRVYELPSELKPKKNTDKKGRIISWGIDIPVSVTSAYNVLSKNGFWEYPLTDRWNQSFENIGNRYTEEIVVENFLARRLAGCVEIQKGEYEILKSQYGNEAKRNSI